MMNYSVNSDHNWVKIKIKANKYQGNKTRSASWKLNDKTD